MKKIILVFFGIFISVTAFSTVAFNNNELTFENELIKNTLSFKNNQIIPTSLFYKSLQKEIYVADHSMPWFEFVINKRLVKSTDALWKYRSHTVRAMKNGGQEIKIEIDALKQLSGLHLIIERQFFPNSTLIRERILLQVTKGTFTLNNLNDKLHFVFPNYTIENKQSKLNLSEIRMATFASEILVDFNPNNTVDDRLWDDVKTFNLAHCHMFHPKTNEFEIDNNQTKIVKGPFAVYKINNFVWLSAYEHASQDKNFESESVKKTVNSNLGDISIDLSQGVVGESGLPTSDNDFWFLGLQSESRNNAISLSLQQLRGCYLEDEVIEKNRGYETVWFVSSVMQSEKDVKPTIQKYLLYQITEHAPSRIPHFYYNTWGMQRDTKNLKGLREIFTESRILEEIKNAVQLNVDLFVLDDGWEETMGVWTPNKERLPNGLKPLVDEMKRNNIIPGIWLSPMGIDSLADRYKKHQEWVLRNKNGKPISAQWDFPAFDFVSGFNRIFIDDCKRLIDQGFLFFKWDAINTFNSLLPDLEHGSSAYSPLEIRDRYAFLLPFYVTRAMKELREYNPNVVVEIDLTEKERCMIGLMPLQEGKFFGMNNGASGYNDYSQYRSKSMRTLINQFVDIIPVELLTYAVYPHNTYPYFSQRYNVNSTLIAGHGFWGNLQLMNDAQRLRVGQMVAKSKRVLPFIQSIPLEVHGAIGASPEVYQQIDAENAVGQVIAFSGSACQSAFEVSLNTDKCLGVLNHSYRLKNGKLHFQFQFNRPDDTREAFILNNEGTGISIISYTGWLNDLRLHVDKKQLIISPGNKGEILIRIPDKFKSLRYNEIPLTPDTKNQETGFVYYKIVVDKLNDYIVNWNL